MTRITGHRQSRNHRILLSLSTLLFFPAAAGAEDLAGGNSAEPRYRIGLEVFASPNSLDGVEPLGFRGSYALDQNWAVEGSFSFRDQDSESFLGDWHVEERYLDFSVRRKIIRNRRLEFFAFGGLGAFRWNEDFQINPEGWPIDEESLTLNLGLGLNVNIGRRFYFRTDLRHHATDLDKLDYFLTNGGQLSLGLGFKL